MSRQRRRHLNTSGGSKFVGFLGGMIGGGLMSALVIEPLLRDTLPISVRATLNAGVQLGLSQIVQSDAAKQRLPDDTLTGAKWSFYTGAAINLLMAGWTAGMSKEQEKKLLSFAPSTSGALSGCGCQACPCEQWSWPNATPVEQSLSGTFLYAPHTGYSQPQA